MIQPGQTPNPTTNISAYFRVVFSKTLKTKWTVHQYERAIESLEAFVGQPVYFGLVTGLRLARWLKQMKVTLNDRTAYRYRRCIIEIVKRALPDTCLVKVEPPTPGTLMHFFETVYRPTRMVGIKPSSVQQVAVAITSFGRFLGRDATVNDLNDSAVCGYMQDLLSEKKLARPTVNCKRSGLLSLWKVAYKKKLALELPDIPKLKEFRRLPNAWTIGEFSKLVQAAQTFQWPKRMLWEVTPYSLSASDFWTSLLVFIYDTGLRKSAALSIAYENIDFETGLVMVEAEQQKQKTEQRFHLSAQCLELIQKIRKPYRKLLFPWPRGKNSLHIHMRRLLVNAGLPANKKCQFHCIRRTTASHIAAAAGIEAAAKHLGHSSSEITKRYVDPQFTSERDGTAYLPRPTLTVTPDADGQGEGGAT